MVFKKIIFQNRHVELRMEKTKLLQRIYKCSLPPLPMPFSEMDTFVLMLPQLNSVVESETSGTKFKVGVLLVDTQMYRYTCKSQIKWNIF